MAGPVEQGWSDILYCEDFFDEGPEDQVFGVNIYKGAATISWQNQRTSAHILDSEDSFDEGPEDQDMGVIISNGAVTRSWQDQRTRDL